MMFSTSFGCWLVFCSSCRVIEANPTSNSYIPFRTDPRDQPHVHHKLEWQQDTTQSQYRPYDPERAVPDAYCPLQFNLGISQRVHSNNKKGMGIVAPPVIFPVLPSLGPGRQVMYTTQYEHFDLLTPSQSQPQATKESIIKAGLMQHVEFPLLFESSSFLTSPVIGDVNGDGILDAILADYDGGIYAMGLQVKDGKRYFHKAQTPRLYIRRQWMESRVNETLGIAVEDKEEEDPAKEEDAVKPEGEGEEDTPKDHRANSHSRPPPHDPYHSYFEYTYGSSGDHEPIIRGVTANVLGQDQEHVEGLEERRKRKMSHDKSKEQNAEPEDEAEKHSLDEDEEEQHVDATHRRLQEEENNVDPNAAAHQEEKKDAKDNTVTGGDEHEHNDPNFLSQEEELPRAEAEAEQVKHAMVEELEEATKQDSHLERGSVIENHHKGGSSKDRKEKGFDRHYEDDGYMGDYHGEYQGDDDMVDRRFFSGDEDDQVAYDGDDHPRSYGDDDYSHRHDDEYPRYDDYYGGRYDTQSEDYYDDKHYVRIPPHILCTPVLAEFPTLYSQNGETEMLLFVAVSYYLDEDEYEGFSSYKRFENSDHGDETEVQRGMYVANAIMVYQYGDSPRWGRQEHLDLSGDHSAPINSTLVGSIPLTEDNSKMGAFALSSPTVADIDGDGTMEVLMGTSMGLVYGFEARNLYTKENWPVQFQYGIEHRILVEDVVGDTNLEIFVADVGGNVVCLDHKANIIWHRNLVSSVSEGNKESELLASSPMVLGDIDGDGVLDVVVTMKIRVPGKPGAGEFIFVLDADTGKDHGTFPIRIWSAKKDSKNIQGGEEFVHQKLPPPLLVDLHADHSDLDKYLHRNGTKWDKPSHTEPQKRPMGGSRGGLHIVQPYGTNLVIVEASSGCLQTIAIGDDILVMVQADDVHGTNNLDLVISTASGNIVTLESPAPFHPLNVWNNGEIRGRTNTFAHGYSASQGIFVHGVSRQFRDIFGVYIPVTFEIFDNRPNIKNEPDRRVYNVEIKEGTSRPVLRKTFNLPGVYTERIYIPQGPGYYVLSVMMKTTHGLIYEDTFHLGYNVNYMDGFGVLLWLPLVIATVCIFLCGTSKSHWDDDDYEGDGRRDSEGILGNPNID